MNVSVVVNTKNEEKYLAQCLSSVSWADEIIVVDMQSSDNTKAIAKQYTDLVYSCEDFGYVEPARNLAISYATGDWIFILDADEVIPDNVSISVRDIILKNEDVSMIAIPRRNYIGNYLIKNSGWGMDYQPRLFKRGKVIWKDIIHTWPEIEGKILYLDLLENFYIEHYNYKDLFDFVQRLNSYTDIEAKSFDVATLNSDWKNIFYLAFDEFSTRYTPDDDGLYSLYLAGCMAFYRFITCCKALEAEGKPTSLILPSNVDEIIMAVKITDRH